MGPLPPSLPTEIQLSDAHRTALASLAPSIQRLPLSYLQEILVLFPQHLSVVMHGVAMVYWLRTPSSIEFSGLL